MKYSVIIPIYNAEKTLRRCLDSLMPQLNNDIEVILVNDGSKDASDDICMDYVEKSSCFKYFEQKNSGVSVARNKGINNANGDYIVFIDSDDYVFSDMFELINNYSLHNDYDLLVSDLFFEDKNKDKPETRIVFESKEMDEIIEKVSNMICNKRINAPLGKVYKRSIIKEFEILFPEGCSIAEDRAFNISYAIHIKSLAVISGSFYCYAGNSQDSLSRTVRDVAELGQQFDVGDKMIKDALLSSDLEKKHLRQIEAAENFCKFRQVYSRAKRMKLRGADRKAILSGIKDDCRELNRDKLYYPNNVYCKKICLPVRLGLYWIIYFISIKLAEKAT